MAHPKVEIETTFVDKVLEGLSLIALLSFGLYVGREYAGLPEEIPVHFNLRGEPDGYGSKVILWVLPCLGLFLWVLFQVLNRYPHTFNYPFEITPENAAFQYGRATRLLRILLVVLALTFLYIGYIMVLSVQKGTGVGLGVWFLPIVMLAIFTPLLHYFLYYSNKK